MQFELSDAIAILERTPEVVSTMLKNLPGDWINANEGGKSWSPFDIVGHYIHGEITDWIPRMEIILNDEPDKIFEPFDRFAQFENSKGKKLCQLLEEFSGLRKRNIKKLLSIQFSEKLLNKTAMHPQLGSVTLRQLLAAWVVHDLTHIHQLSRVLAKQYELEVGPWKEYMGVLNAKQ
jgi:hypothetical protein